MWQLERQGCESTAQVADSHNNAVPEHVENYVPEGPLGHPERRGSDMNLPEFARRIGTCYLDPDDVSFDHHVSCDRKDDHLGDGSHVATVKAEGCAADKLCGVQADSFSVPFSVQEFMFESLAGYAVDNLHDLIYDHRDLILEMARDRFRRGYAEHGSKMYSWSPERRLDETLCELADAVVYPTSGPLT